MKANFPTGMALVGSLPGPSRPGVPKNRFAAPDDAFFVLMLLLFSFAMNAQSTRYRCLTCKDDTLITNARLYGGLIHQHQDFFNKAFSFQGLEAGLILNRRFLVGAYGSLFISNLAVNVPNRPRFIHIGQGGLLLGGVRNRSRPVHAGWLLNVGYFSLRGDDTDFDVFKAGHPSIRLDGLLLTPQVFAEANITRWIKFRTGLAYSFYSFEEQSAITKKDLQNIALSFGFIFCKQ